jgi:hypothetical protein
MFTNLASKALRFAAAVPRCVLLRHMALDGALRKGAG